MQFGLDHLVCLRVVLFIRTHLDWLAALKRKKLVVAVDCRGLVEADVLVLGLVPGALF